MARRADRAARPAVVKVVLSDPLGGRVLVDAASGAAIPVIVAAPTSAAPASAGPSAAAPASAG